MTHLPAAEKPHSYLPHSTIPLRTTVWSIISGISIALPILYFCSVISMAPSDAQAAADNAARASRLVTAPGALAWQALIIYPILEEMFYRGLILQTLRRYLPLWIAVLVPTFIFAMTHLNGHNDVARVSFAFVAGIYFSWLTLRSRSLFPSILCHSAINFTVNFVLTPIFMARDVTTLTHRLHPLPLALLAGSLILFTIGARILQGEFRHRALTVAA